jgi:hypothetical protein
MEFDIEKRTIFVTIHGSHAYGMANEESDVDIRGVAIPTKPYFYGFYRQFNQFEGEFLRDYSIDGKTFIERIEGVVGREVPKDEKIDSVIYDIRKFLKLAAECNPNIIEVLFTDKKFHLLTTPCFEKLIEYRDLFLSTKAKFRFCGYAFSQLKRIKTHRSWLLNPPKKKPMRDDFGLLERSLVSRDHRKAAESLIKKKVEEWILLPDELPKEVLESVRTNTINALSDMWEGLIADCYVKSNSGFEKLQLPLNNFDEFDINVLSNAAGRFLGYSTNFLELLDKERRYKSALKYYNQYQGWKKNRNPARAAMEAKFGYDGKHASHLVRLLRMAEEILVNGKVYVCRPDAEELLSIRKGAWSFDDLLEWANNQQKKLDTIYEEKLSPLPRTPDYQKIDKLCMEIVELVI